MDIIKDCQSYFNLKLPSELLSKRYDKFLSKLSTTNNIELYSPQLVDNVYILCGFRLNFADAIRVLLTFIRPPGTLVPAGLMFCC